MMSSFTRAAFARLTGCNRPNTASDLKNVNGPDAFPY
jgi:hypothetical protein